MHSIVSYQFGDNHIYIHPITKIFRVCENIYVLFHSHIDRFQSRDHFTIGRHIGAHVNSELVSREL